MMEKFSPRTLIAGGALSAAAIAGVGCSNGENNNTSETTVPRVELSTEQAQLAGQLCVNGFDMSTPFEQEFALSNVGGVDSLMNNFTTTNDDGETVAVSEQVFADRLLDEVCKKPTVLATLTAYMIEPAGKGVNGKIAAPDASSLNRAEELAGLYRNNEVAALEAIREIASVVKAEDGAEHIEDFSVIENQGTLIVPERLGEANETTGRLKTEKITVGDLYEGYLFNYLTDDSDLTEKERADLETVKTLVLISDEGQLVIKVWIGDNQVDIDLNESPETTVVSPVVTDAVAEVPAGQTPDSVDAPAGQTPDSVGPANAGQNNNNGGNTDAPGPDSGSPVDNGCDSQNKPGCEGGEEPGTPEEPEIPTGTTPTPTQPTTPPTQPTTPPTTPPTPPPTRPTTTTSTTTTTTSPPPPSTAPPTTKPDIVCNPVIDVCD